MDQDFAPMDESGCRVRIGSNATNTAATLNEQERPHRQRAGGQHLSAASIESPKRQSHFETKTSLTTPTVIANQPRSQFRHQCHAFLIMAMPYFRENARGQCLFGLMILLTLANSAVRVVFSYLARDYWSALSEKRVDEFYRIITHFLVAMVILCPISVMYRYIQQVLTIAWREWLTGRVIRLYFSNRVYYALEKRLDIDGSARGVLEHGYNHSDATKFDDVVQLIQPPIQEMDNPDQRISEDIRSFTEFSLTFFLKIVTSIIDLICFSFILFSIMPQLFFAIFFFATIGTILTVCIGKGLIHLNYIALQREADFRFSLVRVRENAESIAFYAGEAVEERETDLKFAKVIDNMVSINKNQRNLDFWTTSYTYITWILPIIVVAPEYFAGNVQMGVISQASGAFVHILEDLSIVVNSFNDLSRFCASIDRLYSFISAIQKLDHGRSIMSLLSATDSGNTSLMNSVPLNMNLNSNVIRVKEYDPSLTIPLFSETSLSTPSTLSPAILSIRGLRLVTPDNKRTLIQNLDLTVMKGTNLLIVGPSGSGKSSLLRAIAGLWSTGAGEIIRPQAEHVYFLPQRPYCPPGSLRDQLFYPSTEYEEDYVHGGRDTSNHRPDGGSIPKENRRLAWKDWGDAGLLNVLASVDLPDLASRAGDGDPIRGLYTVLDWGNVLSLGEQQRLAFGRLVINRPQLVVMDESTSALDVLAERKLYNLLKNISPTCISVGHRPTLLEYHDWKLSIHNQLGVLSEIPRHGSAIDEGFILT